jgi:hypothetical protein
MIDRAFSQAVTASEAGVAGPDNGYINISGRASVATPGHYPFVALTVMLVGFETMS